MQIAICHEYVIPARGGAEMYVADLVRRLAAEGHEVHLYARRWDAASLPAALHVHRLPRLPGPRFLRPWRFSAACAEALERDRPEVSIGFDKVRGTDVLYPLGGLHVACKDHNRLKYPRQWQRELTALVQKFEPALHSFLLLERRQLLGERRPLLVANSRFVRRHAEKYYGIPPASVPVLYNAIDPARFAEDDRPRLRAESRARWGLRPDETVGTLIAMNYRLKGLDPLLHALRLLPAAAPFKLLVAGSTQTRSYERLAQQLGVADRVRFIGHCAEVRRVFFASDLLVHPTFYDPCSLVVLEALACGLPVVTTRYNGASELLHPPREGFVIRDPHDHAELAEALMVLLDPAVRSACGRAARQTAAGWTFEHHYRGLLDVLRRAAAAKQAA